MKTFSEPIGSIPVLISGIKTSSIEINLELGNIFIVELTRNIVLSFINPQQTFEYKVIFKQDSTGGRTVTDDEGNLIAISSDPESVTILKFTAVDGSLYYESPLTYAVLPSAKRISISSILDISAIFNLRPSEICTVYWAVVPSATSARTKTQIVAGTGANDYGTIDVAAGGVDKNDAMSSLVANSTYIVYYYIKDARDNESEVLTKAFTTLLETPVLTAAEQGPTEIHVTWPNVTGNEGYELEISSNGTTWEEPIVLDQDVVIYHHTGLTLGNTRYYRLTALGDGLVSFDSPVSAIVNETTEA